MPRGKSVGKRALAPDHRYHSVLVAKFINYIMKSGKKSVAERIVYQALEALGKKREQPPLQIFEKVVDAVRPQVEVRSRRVGGANYQVPMPVSGERQNALAFRWLIGAAQAHKGHSMEEKLLAEFNDVLDGAGGSLKKKEDVHRMAEANKAFAHFARFKR